MAEPNGYWLLSADDNNDVYVCAACVEKHGKSTDRPVDEEAFSIIPLSCGFHVYQGRPGDYV